MIASNAEAQDLPTVRAAAAAYQIPMVGRSLWQVTNSFVPLFAIYALMYLSLALPYWTTLALALLAAGFVVRIFIIQHDCGHAAFFRSRWANDLVGTMCSLVTLTPYAMWRRQHAGHHGNWNNLDRRDSGVDVYSSCLTVAEYVKLSWSRRLLYRATHHPVVLLLLLPPAVFLFLYRVPFDTPKSWRAERRSVHLTNLALLALFGVLGLAFGFVNLLQVQLPIALLSAIIGVWLFSVQHRFERTQWMRREKWDFVAASLYGSSFLCLPKVLHWFTGNIGFHHVHHLAPRVPNYRLRECHEALAALQTARRLTLWTALRSSTFALWHEAEEKMVPFRRARTAGCAVTGAGVP